MITFGHEKAPGSKMRRRWCLLLKMRLGAWCGLLAQVVLEVLRLQSIYPNGDGSILGEPRRLWERDLVVVPDRTRVPFRFDEPLSVF